MPFRQLYKVHEGFFDTRAAWLSGKLDMRCKPTVNNSMDSGITGHISGRPFRLEACWAVLTMHVASQTGYLQMANISLPVSSVSMFL